MKFFTSIAILGSILALSFAQTSDTPPRNHFAVNEGSVVCLTADMAIQFSIDYIEEDHKNKTQVINLPSVHQTAGGKVSGKCGNDTNTLIIEFFTNWTLSMDFGKTADSFSLHNITLTYNTSEYLNKPLAKGIFTTSATNLDLLKGKLVPPFLCKKNVNVALTPAVRVTLTYVQVQAFSTSTKDEFATSSILAFSYPRTADTPALNHFRMSECGVVCLTADMAIQFSIGYMGEDNTKKTQVINLPSVDQPNANVIIGGECGDDRNTLSVEFFTGWKLTMGFGKDSYTFSLQNISLTYDMSEHFDKLITRGSMTRMETDVGLFKGNLAQSLLCLKNSSVALSEATVTFSYVQVQAFRTSTNDAFADPDDCDTEVNEIHTIVIGSTLGVLVLIILCAYVIVRTQAKRGYRGI